jgi:hypothetical protein
MPLDEAVSHYASDQLQRARRFAQRRQKAHEAVKTLTAIERIRSPDVHESVKETLAYTFKIDRSKLDSDPFCRRNSNRYPLVAPPTRRLGEDHFSAMIGELTARILMGEFVLLGFEHPRRHGDEPCAIASDVLAAKPDLDFYNSEVRGSGLRYIGVRLVRQAPSLQPAGKVEKRHQKIIEAGRILIGEGIISPEMTDQRIADKVREKLKKNRKSRGYGDETIAELIRPLFEESE